VLVYDARGRITQTAVSGSAARNLRSCARQALARVRLDPGDRRSGRAAFTLSLAR
jgi:hypothetical protein